MTSRVETMISSCCLRLLMVTLDLQSVTIGQYESPAMEVEQEVKHQTYQDGPFPYYQMGCAPDVINGSIHFVPTGDWSQFFCVTGVPLTPGNYAVDVEIKLNQVRNTSR